MDQPQESSGRGPGDLETNWTRQQVRAQLFGRADPVTVGRYALGELLGRGGMGVVFAAHDPVLVRDAAVKVMAADVADTYRLLREGRALARLSHPNVVRVLDAGTDRGRTYLVIERVRGQTLEAWRTAQPRGEDEIVAVMLAAGSGLAAAHDHGLVHRDVKPRNVLIDSEGVARLSDFGLVRAHQDEGASVQADETVASPSAALRDDGATASAIVGTFEYMAPEQLAGAEADERADQFAFAATFYEMLFDERPFAGASATERLRATRGEPSGAPRARGHWAYEVLLRGLDAEPGERHSTMHAMLDEIARRRDSIRAAERLLRTAENLADELARDDVDLDALHHQTEGAREELAGARRAWPHNPELERPELLLGDLAAALQARRRASIEREHDPELGDHYKAKWVAGVSVAWAAGYAALGVVMHAAPGAVGNGALVAFYGFFVVLHVFVALHTERDHHQATVASRRLSQITMCSYLGHTFVVLLGMSAGLDVTATLTMTQAMATVLWATAAVAYDRRLAVIAPFTAAAAITGAIQPGWVFGAAALAAWLGLGLLAVAFRRGEDRPVLRPRRGR